MGRCRPKGRFVAETVGVALVFLCLYAAAVLRLFPAGGEAQDQWQDNQMRAQWYVQHAGGYAVVIAGSSMAARLPADALPAGCYNLAMAGGGALTGLEIVLRTTPAPQVVLVEANDTLFREADQTVLRSVFQPITFRLRALFPVLGDAYQPVSIATRLLRERFNLMRDGAEPPLPPHVYEELFAMQRQAQQQVPPPQMLAAALDRLGGVVQRVQARGVHVAFFEIPIAPGLDDSPLRIATRQALAARFPPPRHTWLPRADARDYVTRDGVHLQAASARQFAAFLGREADRIVSEPRNGPAPS